MPVKITGYHRVREIEEELALLGRENDPPPLFLVPSPGDRELLREMILEKVSFGSCEPSILRWEDLYREAARELDIPREARRRQIDPPDHWLIVRHVLERLRARVDESSIPAGARHRGFLWTLGNDLRELLREEVHPLILASSMGCLSDCQGEDCPALPAPEAMLCRLYRDYLAYLGSHSLTDSAQTATVIGEIILKDPSAAAEWISGRQIVFVGFLSFTRSQTGLIRQLSQLGARVTIYMPECGLRVHDARAQLSGHPSDPHPAKKFEPFPFLPLAAGDHRLEMETVARNLALWRAGRGEFFSRLGIPFPGWGQIGLSLDGPRLECAEEVLSRYRIPYTVQGGPTVSETPLWKTASSALEASSLGYPPEETAHILSQPWIAPEGFPLSDSLRRGPQGEKGWREYLETHGDKRVLSFFNGMTAFVSVIEGGGSPSRLLRALRDLAGTDGHSGPGLSLSRFIIDYPPLDETARRLNAALKELEQKMEQMSEMESGIGPAGSEVLQGNDAVAFLSAWSERSTIWQPPKTRDSLNIYVENPPVLARHRVFLVTGLTAEAWPGRLQESPLLGDRHKEAIHNDPNTALSPSHLPLLREKRIQREALLLRMIASADEVCIGSRPNQDSSGRPLQPSGFIASALSRTPPWIVETGSDPPFSRSMKDVIPGDEDPSIEGIEARTSDPPRSPARLSMIPPPTPWPEGLPKRVQASGIDTWKECPFRFYAGRVLGMERSRPWGFDPARAGNVAHALWDKVWGERMATGEKLTDLAQSHWERAVIDHYPELVQFPRHLGRLKEQTLRMASLQQEMDDEGLAEARVNQKREQLIEMETDGVLFRGKFDRIDLLSDGSALLFDYKTGRGDNLNNSLQLPAYALMLQSASDIEVSGYAYLSQADLSITGRLDGLAGEALPGWRKSSRTGLKEMVSRARETVMAMAKAVMESSFPPNYSNVNVCRYCEYQDLCRRKESVGAAPAEDDGNVD